ncbi:MAG: urease accessory protein UreF [Limimaricola sp.]|uniref:urease accessory protein UreF n=1 Tax=Limimaricola sp. TaxID=2211665 RepID=UPI001D9B609F|nr:urease accessory UreF family protein [Limimaricola sp.]MBI1415821.1 urease accessory protein UreF [Limimaricola sp.]
MRIDDLLTLAQWLAPTFPTGAFAWSHGLEAAVAGGEVRDAAGLADWLAAVIDLGAGRADCILLGAAWRAEADEVAALAELADALAPSRERRLETLQQGAAFAAAVRAVWGFDLPDIALPVAVGRAARLAGLPAGPVAALWLQGFAGNLVQAALRLMPLGQTAGQRVLHGLQPLIARVATEALAATPDDIGTGTLAVDIAAMRHEAQYSRIFRS